MALQPKYESLSGEDVETDGEPVCLMQRPNIMTRLENVANRNMKGEQQDSGNFSLSPQTSLEPPPLKEKVPVQCSDGEATPDLPDLEKKLDNLNLQEVDEGIVSYTSVKSLESVDSDCSDIVEVDLFEQDLDGDSIIHLAILGDAPNLASVLIDIAEDTDCLNLQNDLYQTALHLAIITEHYDIAVQLVKKGADVRRCDKQGNTPMHLACRKGEKVVIKALLETFSNNEAARQKYFSVKNVEGLTCLHLAAEQKHFLIMGYLFAKGANVNMGDAKSGRTILHYAVEKRDLETVALLLTHPEINADSKTFKGETPLVLAYWRNYQDIVKKLKNNGAYFGYDLFEESDEAS